MGIASDLSDIKEVSDTLTGNKVARFAYTQQAYDDNDADGVQAYNVNNEQNIPVASASIMKVNDTVIDKGWRARASSITRMLMNHFLGRLSYNVNKLTDMFDSLLTAINANLGVADGFATLNASGKVPDAQLNMGVANGLATINADGKIALLNNVVNTGDSDTPVIGGTTKFTTGGAYADKTDTPIEGSRRNFTSSGAYTELAKKAPNWHASVDTTYGQATTNYYGHVKLKTSVWVNHVLTPVSQIIRTDCDRFCIYINPHSVSKSLQLKNPTDSSLKIVVIAFSASGSSTMITEISAGDTIQVTTPESGLVITIPMIDTTYYLV